MNAIRLRPGVHYAPVDGGVYFSSARATFVVRGPAVLFRVVDTCLPLLEDGTDVDDLVAAVGAPAARRLITSLVETLDSRGLLLHLDRLVGPEPPAAERQRFRESLAYLETHRDDPYADFRRLRAARVLLSGPAEALGPAARGLLRAGIGQVMVATPEPHRLTALATRHPEVQLLLCHSEGIPTLVAGRLPDAAVIFTEDTFPADAIQRLPARCLVIPVRLGKDLAIVGPAIGPDRDLGGAERLWARAATWSRRDGDDLLVRPSGDLLAGALAGQSALDALVGLNRGRVHLVHGPDLMSDALTPTLDGPDVWDPPISFPGGHGTPPPAMLEPTSGDEVMAFGGPSSVDTAGSPAARPDDAAPALGGLAGGDTAPAVEATDSGDRATGWAAPQDDATRAPAGGAPTGGAPTGSAPTGRAPAGSAPAGVGGVGSGVRGWLDSASQRWAGLFRVTVPGDLPQMPVAITLAEGRSDRFDGRVLGFGPDQEASTTEAGLAALRRHCSPPAGAGATIVAAAGRNETQWRLDGALRLLAGTAVEWDPMAWLGVDDAEARRLWRALEEHELTPARVTSTRVPGFGWTLVAVHDGRTGTPLGAGWGPRAAVGAVAALSAAIATVQVRRTVDPGFPPGTIYPGFLDHLHAAHVAELERAVQDWLGAEHRRLTGRRLARDPVTGPLGAWCGTVGLDG